MFGHGFGSATVVAPDMVASSEKRQRNTTGIALGHRAAIPAMQDTRKPFAIQVQNRQRVLP
jgi:hypothetical protein